MATQVQDDYLICREYNEQISKKSAEHPGFITFQHENGDHYFAWVNGDEIVLRSEAYPDAEKMERGVKAILKNCDLTERYSVLEEHGAHFLILWGGGDHQAHTGNMEKHSEIGRSCPHKSRVELNALLQFKGADFANKVIPIEAATSSVAGTVAAGAASVSAVAATVTNPVSATIETAKETAAAAVTSATSFASSATENVAATGAKVLDTVTDGNSGGGMGWLKWLLPLLLLAGVYFGWKSCSDKDAASTSTAASTTTIVAGDDTTHKATTTDTTHTTTVATHESTKVKLADGVEINAFKGGIEDRLVTFLNDKTATIDTTKKGDYWYDFDNLNFEFGKTTLTKESQGQIGNIVAILKAYPNFKMKIGAYTDKKGDDAGNLKLSQNRADAVLAAIKAAGGNASQITKAEGYGETLAKIAETATDAERLVDRRTAIKVVAK